MREREGGVREGGGQRGQLLGVLRRLEHPGARPPRNVRGLAAPSSGTRSAPSGPAPGRRPASPGRGRAIQDVTGEVQVEQFDLFLDRPGTGHAWRPPAVSWPSARRARGPARSGDRRRTAGTLAAGRDGLPGSPSTAAGAGADPGEQVHQVRGARTRHADHDDRFRSGSP